MNIWWEGGVRGMATEDEEREERRGFRTED